MKTHSHGKPQPPAFMIRVHLIDGTVEAFAQTDAVAAKTLWDKIEPSRLFCVDGQVERNITKILAEV